MKYEKTEYPRHGARSVIFTIENSCSAVAAVEQDVSLIDLKWGAPSIRVRWQNKDKNTALFLDELSALTEIVNEAVAIAKEWDVKTGTPLEREESK